MNRRRWHKREWFRLATALLYSMWSLVELVFLSAIHLPVTEWDWMKISGLISVVVGLCFGLELRGNQQVALRTLKRRGTLNVDEGVETILRRTDRFADWTGFLGTCSTVVLFVLCIGRTGTAWWLYWLMLMVIIGFPIWYVFGRLLSSIAWEWKHLLPRLTNVVPGHVDGVGGLKPFGDLLFQRSLIATAGAAHIGLWTFLIPIWQLRDYSDWLDFYLILLMCFIGLIVLTSILPAFWARYLLQEKRFALQLRADEMAYEISVLQEKLHSQSASSTVPSEDVEKRIKYLTDRFHEIVNLPRWPTDQATVRWARAELIALGSSLLFGIAEKAGVFEAFKQGIGLN